jgi:hypothetical protein
MSASLHIRFHGKDRFHTDRRSVPAQPDYFKAGEDLQEGEEFEGKAAIARSDAQEERKDNETDSRRAPRPDRYCPCMAEEAPGWGLEEAPRWAPFRQTVEAYNIYFFSIVGFFLTAIFEILGFVLALRSKPSTGDKDKTG